MPTWEIVGLVILGLVVLIAAIRFGFLGLLLEILFSILGGGSSGGSSFGGGSFGGGGSSNSWDDD